MEIVICVLALAALCRVQPPRDATTRPAVAVERNLRRRIEILRHLGLHGS